MRRFPSNRRVVTAAMRAGKSDLLSGILPLGCAFSYEAAQLITAAIPTDDSRTLADLGIAWSQPRQFDHRIPPAPRVPGMPLTAHTSASIRTAAATPL